MIRMIALALALGIGAAVGHGDEGNDDKGGALRGQGADP
jgi:hypothetical protein